MAQSELSNRVERIDHGVAIMEDRSWSSASRASGSR